jgi:aryl-alcohol dehydrogenase-like predicted oxidoreductase
VRDVTELLADLPPFIYGTTRLGHGDVPREQQRAMARSALDAGLWLHTSRQYDHALEVLGEAFAEDPARVPPLIVKLGGGTADDVRQTLAENLGPLGLRSIAIGQLNPVGGLADALVSGGPLLDELRALRDEGSVGRFVLEVFPWTSPAALAGLRAGRLDGLVDGFITYYNPLQRFAANELWDELLDRDAAIISMRTVSGAPVEVLRDVPGAAWRPYLRDRAAEVASVVERSGVASWTEFCLRFVRSTPQVVATVGSTSRQEHLDELLEQSRRTETLPVDVLDELDALQRRWSAEVDAHAEPWSM